MLSVQASVSKGWLYKEAGFFFDKEYYFDPFFRKEQDRKIDKYLSDRFHGYAIYNMESNLVQAEFVKDSQILVGGIQPNLILGACLGAELIFFKDQDADINDKPLKYLNNLDELPKPATLIDSSFVKMLDFQIRSIKNEHPELRVIPSFFWDVSGRATIHGFITSSLKLFGETIFLKIFDEPGFVKTIHEWITETYIVLIRHFSELGDITITSVHVGECSGSMLNEEQFEKFIVPFMNKIGNKLGTIRLHSCGNSDHLLEAFNKINNLKVIDAGSDTSVTSMRKVFGIKRELNVEPPVKILLEGVDSKEVIFWLDKILSENKGGPIKIEYHIEPGYSLSSCLALQDVLFNRGLCEKIDN